jgi:3'-phosphoadenosine 5'-phosphosulfate sulfotransferase (PAPS reductase)/FAD synthetase
MIKHIVCYSGGHSSALVAIEVVRKFGKENTILLNHDIHSNSEDKDIKRFKQEVADYLEIPITYANHPEWDTKDQFDVVVDASAFKVGKGTALCTHRLKTQPFEKYLKEYFSDKGCVLYYGFDKNELHRVQRRAGILGNMGY